MTHDPTPRTIARIKASFGAQGLMRHLGATIAAIRSGEVVLHLPYRAELTQQMGYFHAGGTSALADTAGGYAALTLFPEGHEVLTTEFKLNLLNPARGERLEAVGRVIKPGRTLTVCQLDVFAVEGEARTHVATGLQTLICIAARLSSGQPAQVTPPS
ncbi:PaaI family thioesterase [Paracoccus liaowanqingii]|nr:PaaI family thioesterase [Paracoccus liaowanqingii]